MLGLAALGGCDDGVTGPGDCASRPTAGVDFQGEMRALVQDAASHARGIRPGFSVVPHEGVALSTADGEPAGTVVPAYLAAMNGIGQGGVFYGLEEDGVPSDPARNGRLIGFLDRLLAAGKPVLATSYCRDSTLINDAHALAVQHGYLEFASCSRDLSCLPAYPASPFHEHPGDVDDLVQARNFLLRSHDVPGAERGIYLAETAATNYDVLIVNPFPGNALLTPAEVEGMGTKVNGGRRLVLAAVNIGRAEAHRDYWQETWNTELPDWVDRPCPGSPGIYDVHYWDPAWRAIIMGSEGAVLDRIVAAGFDGVYLLGVDAYESFASRFG